MSSQDRARPRRLRRSPTHPSTFTIRGAVDPQQRDNPQRISGRSHAAAKRSLFSKLPGGHRTARRGLSVAAWLIQAAPLWRPTNPHVACATVLSPPRQTGSVTKSHPWRLTHSPNHLDRPAQAPRVCRSHLLGRERVLSIGEGCWVMCPTGSVEKRDLFARSATWTYGVAALSAAAVRGAGRTHDPAAFAGHSASAIRLTRASRRLAVAVPASRRSPSQPTNKSHSRTH